MEGKDSAVDRQHESGSAKQQPAPPDERLTMTAMLDKLASTQRLGNQKQIS